MKINVPFRVRVALYLANVLGTPVVVYLRAKGFIGDLELTLWGAEIAAAFVVAGLNASTGESAELRISATQVTEIADHVDRRAGARAAQANRKGRR